MVLFHYVKANKKDGLMKVLVLLPRQLFETIYGAFEMAYFVLISCSFKAKKLFHVALFL